MFTAVLPPTAASTIASRLVGTSRDESGQVGGGSPADADDGVAAGEPVPGQPGPQIRGHRDRLGRLARRHLLAVHRVPGAGQHPAHRARDLAQTFGMHNDDRAGRRPHEPGQLGEHARADDHLVGALAINSDPGDRH
jgi:hypothetical protein